MTYKSESQFPPKDTALSAPELPHSFAQFPLRLHDMLDQAELEGYQHVVCWLPGGDGFQIHDPESMLPILKKCGLNQSKWKSFLRQLQNYGFRREIRGPNKGKVTHEMFYRGRRDLCLNIRRNKKWNSADNVRDQVTDKSSAYTNLAIAINDANDYPRAALSAPLLMQSKIPPRSIATASFGDKRHSAKNASFDFNPSLSVRRTDGLRIDEEWRDSRKVFMNGAEQLIWDIQKELTEVKSNAMQKSIFELCDFEPLDFRVPSPDPLARELTGGMGAAEVTEKMCSIFVEEPSLEETYGHYSLPATSPVFPF